MAEGLVSKELSSKAILAGARDFYNNTLVKATSADPPLTNVFRMFEAKQQALGYKNNKRSFDEATSTDKGTTLTRRQRK